MVLNTTFQYEKSIYKVFVLRHEQTGIIFQTAFGILHIDAIKESFFCDFLKIASVGYTGYLRRKRGLGYGY
jgi:hypothetical protein